MPDLMKTWQEKEDEARLLASAAIQLVDRSSSLSEWDVERLAHLEQRLENLERQVYMGGGTPEQVARVADLRNRFETKLSAGQKELVTEQIRQNKREEVYFLLACIFIAAVLMGCILLVKLVAVAG